MDYNELRDLIWVTLQGCPRHAAYRGKQPPHANCDGCRNVYSVRARLLQYYPPPVDTNLIYVGLADPRCLFCYRIHPHTIEQHTAQVAEQQRLAH
jgi:hypothetical protein